MNRIGSDLSRLCVKISTNATFSMHSISNIRCTFAPVNINNVYGNILGGIKKFSKMKKNLDLNAYGVKELNIWEVQQTNGGCLLVSAFASDGNPNTRSKINGKRMGV
ncbi:MAG: hypothetical protein LBG92_09490 [Prevotellaceae bacterium]|jgi:hypothetical protein|nr:hypothetical protein [Prevotellaceae bacterium]